MNKRETKKKTRNHTDTHKTDGSEGQSAVRVKVSPGINLSIPTVFFSSHSAIALLPKFLIMRSERMDREIGMYTSMEKQGQ